MRAVLFRLLQPGPMFSLPQAPRHVRSRTSQKAPQEAGALRIHGARAPPCVLTPPGLDPRPYPPLAPPGSKSSARATSAPCGLGQGARQHLPETEVQLEFADVEAKWPPEDQKLQRPEDRWEGPSPAEEESPPLPSSPWVPAPDQAFRGHRREVSWAWVSSVRRQGPAAWGGLARLPCL